MEILKDPEVSPSLYERRMDKEDATEDGGVEGVGVGFF